MPNNCEWWGKTHAESLKWHKEQITQLSQGCSLEGMYTAHLRLTEKHVVDFLLVIIELFLLGVMGAVLPVNIDWKLLFLKRMGQFGPTFQVEGYSSTNHYFCRKTRCIDLLCDIRIWADFFHFVTIHAFDRQIDGQNCLVTTILWLHSCSMLKSLVGSKMWHTGNSHVVILVM